MQMNRDINILKANRWGQFSKKRKEIMGIATLWIMFLHCYYELYHGFHFPILSHLSFFGNLGVEIFLIQSGMGLYYSLENDSNIYRFYAKRIKKVVIPWILLSIPYWLIQTIIVSKGTIEDFIFNVLGISFWTKGIATTWYINLTIVLYILYPVIYSIQKKKKEIIWLILLGSIGLDILYRYIDYEHFQMIEIALTRIPAFLFGCALGQHLFRYKDAKESMILYMYTIFAVFLYCSGFIMNLNGHNGSIYCRFGGTGIAVAVSFVCTETLLRYKGFCKILSNLGNISLEVYLIHVFIRNIVHKLALGADSSNSIKFLISTSVIFVSALVSFLAHRFFNDWTIGWIRKMTLDTDSLEFYIIKKEENDQ